MKTSLITLILLVLAAQSLWAQERWETYTSKDDVNSIAIEGNKVWIGSRGGVLLRDTAGNILAEYTKADGLADNNVRSIAIDAQGNKWFATANGLSKFEGATWTTYNVTNSGLTSNYVKYVIIDAQGNKWLSFGDWVGVSKFDDSTWTVYNTSNSGLADNLVSSMAIDAKGNKWFGTNEAISKFDGNTWTRYDKTNSGLENVSVYSIAIDAQDNKWFGTTRGVFKLEDSTWTTYNTHNSDLKLNTINTIAIDAQGNKWIGSEYGGVAKFDDNNWISYNSSNSGLVYDRVTSVAIDAGGNIWFGTSSGVSKFKDNTWMTYNTINLAYYEIRSIAIDAQGNKWFGTPNGISKFDDSTWTVYDTTNSGLANNYVKSIVIDAQGSKWFGTVGGVSKFDGNTWTTYTSSNSGLASNLVNAMAIDVQGNKWFGTNSGVSKFDGSIWINYNNKNSGLENNLIYSVAVDRQGNKWFGTDKGKISKFDGITWTTYNIANSGFPSNDVYSIAIDAQGIKWFGTNGGGVSSFDDSTWTEYNTANSGFPHNWVSYIAIDVQGNKWFGTNGGVSKFDDRTWTTYNPFNSGLVFEEVSSIAFDTKGNVWFGTNAYGTSVLFDGNPFNNTYSKTISGKVFLDKNKNSIKDTNEHYLSNQKVSLNQGKQIAYTNTQGVYTLEADTGKTYTLSYIPTGNYKLSKDTSFTLRLGSNPINLPDFAVYAPYTTIYKSNIVTLSGRCSQETTMWLTYNNFGTTIDNTKIEIQLDKDIIVKNAYPAYDSLKNNKMYFTLANFQAGTDRQIKLNVQNPDFTRSGDTLLYTSKLAANGKVFADTLKRRVTCAYDPNIKEVSPAPIGAKNYSLKNKPLNYTVHFQNTGNDTAYHVLIKDTISKFLDYNSLQITGSSHSLSTTLDTTSGLAQFMFYNIMLADSNTNEKASHGFVSYTIKPKANLPEETMIKNTAYIYFDYNPAVVTNTTLNNLVTTIPTAKVTAIEDYIFTPTSIIIPHPLSSRSAIQFKNNSSANATLQVLDLTGQSVLAKTTTENEFQLNRNEFNSSGLYIYQIKVGDDIITGRLLVE